MRNFLTVSALVVLTACGGGDGGGDEATGPSTNDTPIVNAGVLQNILAGTAVTLDGSASSDANGDALSYVWTLTSKPAGSAASLSNPTSPKPTFQADVAGTYVASLVVNDGKVSSQAGTVTVTATVANAAPVANAGIAQNTVTGTAVTLDGSASSDANGDALSYVWTLTSKPAGSEATLNGANMVNPTFVADVAGSYVASLVARDGSLNSTPATVTVTVAAKDYSNLTDYSKVGNTLISAIRVMNENLLANPIFLEKLYSDNSVVFNIPIQNYFGSDVAKDMSKASMIVTTIKADFPVQAASDTKPYRMKYDEYDKNNTIIYTFGIGSIYGCSNANDVKNPTSECVTYYFSEVRNNTLLMSGSSSINLVKTTSDGLIYLSKPVN